MYGIHEQTGRKKEVNLIEGKRKCGYCGKKLSIYNLNEWCFVHVNKGVKQEQVEEQEKLAKQKAKQKAKLDAKKEKK